MRCTYERGLVLAAALFLALTPTVRGGATKTVTAEARYVMADGDTLSSAEEKVLQRAQRRAVEEAGVYLESTFYDLEKQSQGRTTRQTSWEIRTIAAAITETEILDSSRAFENERPVFFMRIRATVDIQQLGDAVRRLQSEAQLANHFHELQQENLHLRSQLRELQQEPAGVRMLVIEPTGKAEPVARAKQQLETALHTPDLWKKIQLASDAAQLDPNSAEPLIVRGQAYLRLVSVAYSERSGASGYSDYIQKARQDFEQALQRDSKNPWAWIGKGDVDTWLKRTDEIGRASCRERV